MVRTPCRGFWSAQRADPATKFVFIRVHSWLRRLSSSGQRCAKMSNFVFNIVWIFNRLRDFIAKKPAIAAPQIVELFFYGRLGDAERRSQIVIRNIGTICG